MAAAGGTAPYSWSSASLPAGLSLSAAGALSGTPTAAGSSAVTLTVSDSSSPAKTASQAFNLTVAAGTLTITSSTLPNGQVGVPYTSTTLAATGGTLPYTWFYASPLPAGLALSATGVLSGTPTAFPTVTSITFTVQDAVGKAVSATLMIAITQASGTFTITTTVLPAAQVNVAYSATLAASGGTTPYGWSITTGTLPAGLSLSASTGAITGTATAAASTALTFRVHDSTAPTARTATANLTLTVGNSALSITSTPRSAATTQVVSLVATTTDAAGVNWTATGGSFSPARTPNGVASSFTAPSTAGVYTITATGVTDSSKTSSVTIGVTDLGGVYTQHNDLSRDGTNLREFALTTANVNTNTFGKLFSCAADGAVYTQPLWVANVTISGAKHNVVFVATEHDGLFAFDADASPCVTLWHVSLIDAAHGAIGSGGEFPLVGGVTGSPVGMGAGDISPEIGVTATPVIDPATNILYVASKSTDAAVANFYQRLHAIDITTGSEKTGSPVTIAATYPGTFDGGTVVTFNSQQELERAGLALVNGAVCLSFASHEDEPPFYGWVINYTYNGSTFVQSSVLNVSPNGGYGGIWMSGAAPAADSSGNIYVLTSNGPFDVTSSSTPNNDYGDSLLQLDTHLNVTQYFTPTDQLSDRTNDKDFGAGGPAVLADLPAGSPVTHLIIGGGKDGSLYVINRDLFGGSGDGFAWQQIPFGTGIFATGAYWNNNFYLGGYSAPVRNYQMNTTTAQMSLATSSTAVFGFPGTSPSVSATGTTNGILWAMNNNTWCTNRSQACGPTVLYAFDATNLATELWDSSMVAADAAGNAVKYSVPTIANGKVYIGSRGNNAGGSDSSTSTPGQVDVYGLK